MVWIEETQQCTLPEAHYTMKLQSLSAWCMQQHNIYYALKRLSALWLCAEVSRDLGKRACDKPFAEEASMNSCVAEVTPAFMI